MVGHAYTGKKHFYFLTNVSVFNPFLCICTHSMCFLMTVVRAYREFINKLIHCK